MNTCSWCGKTSAEVRHIVSGPCVAICNECAEVVLYAFETAGIHFASLTTIDADQKDKLRGFNPGRKFSLEPLPAHELSSRQLLES